MPFFFGYAALLAAGLLIRQWWERMGEHRHPLFEADRVTQPENGLEMFFDPDHMAVDSLHEGLVCFDHRSGN